MTGSMWICGLSMEMELAEELGVVGKCRGCLYCDGITNFGLATCQKKGKIKEKENCEEWVVDHR